MLCKEEGFIPEYVDEFRKDKDRKKKKRLVNTQINYSHL